MRSGQCMELVTGGSDMWIFIVFVCVTVTAIIIFVNYRRTKKTMDTIEEMLNVAVKGEFTEGQFDETRMSALETKFAHYLSASALSAQNVEAEKDKIKALIADISIRQKRRSQIFSYIVSFYLKRSFHSKLKEMCLQSMNRRRN